jgi:hypothetical protein
MVWCGVIMCKEWNAMEEEKQHKGVGGKKGNKMQFLLLVLPPSWKSSLDWNLFGRTEREGEGDREILSPLCC